jgi:hypothetical protein
MKNINLLIFILFTFTVSKAVNANNFEDDFIAAAMERTTKKITYDGGYYAIAYPNGDVPENIGVCTDVVIRSYRQLGIDLQKLLHEDITVNFDKYPSSRIWGLTKPDKNIDHRRVPNLKVFFARYGNSLAVTNNPKDYKPGDLVTWVLPGNLPHIGIVTNDLSEQGVPLIVHNIGRGPKLEDRLFSYKITGHYRYQPN